MRPPLAISRLSLRPFPGPGLVAAAAAVAGLLGISGAAAGPTIGSPAAPAEVDGPPAATAGADRLPGEPPAGPPNFPGPADPGDIAEIARTALVADVERIIPGSTFHLIFQVSLARGWHTYWEFAGASGLPPEFRVEAPAGFVVGTPRFPRPQRFRGPEGETIGYEGEAWIFIPVTAPRTLPTTNAPIRFTVDATYLVCRESCLIGSKRATLALPAAGDPADGPGRTAPRAAAWRDRLPAPNDPDRVPAAVDAPGTAEPALVVRVPDAALDGGPAARPDFFASPRPGVEFGPPRVTRDGDGWTIAVPLAYEAANARDGRFVVRGLVALGPRPSDPVRQIEFTFPAGG